MIRTLFHHEKKLFHPYIHIIVSSWSRSIQRTLYLFRPNIVSIGQYRDISTVSRTTIKGNDKVLIESVTDSKTSLKGESRNSSTRQKKAKKKPKKTDNKPVSDENACLSLEKYLEVARLRSSSVNSTVFHGTFYELNFMEFLQKNFTVNRIIHQGGKDDKGIDIRATWYPVDNFGLISDKEPVKKFVKVNSISRVRPIALKKSKTVKLFIQCKSWKKSRIDAKLIREMNGTFTNTGRGDVGPSSNSRTRNFLMIVCPTGFTRQGRMDFDRSLLPLMFTKFSRAKICDLKKSPYDIKNYNKGQFESFYCNPMAAALLKGLNWSEFMKHLEVEQT